MCYVNVTHCYTHVTRKQTSRVRTG
jgi:hypothetical protein